MNGNMTNNDYLLIRITVPIDCRHSTAIRQPAMPDAAIVIDDHDAIRAEGLVPGLSNLRGQAAEGQERQGSVALALAKLAPSFRNR